MVLTDGLCAGTSPRATCVFAKDETLFAVPFDLGALKVTGSAIPVVEDVAIADGDGLRLVRRRA